MTQRYTWKQVRAAAARFERAIRDAMPLTPECIHLSVEPGNVTNGITATLHWRQNTSLHLADYPIPGGQSLTRSARSSFDMLADRARVIEDVTYWKERVK